jgi:hypothetical protein
MSQRDRRGRTNQAVPLSPRSQCVTAAKRPAQLRPAGDRRAKLMPVGALPGGACRSRLPRARSYLIVVLGSACDAAFWTSRSGPGIERGGDEGMPERVRRDDLSHPAATRGAPDDPPSAVPVQPPPVRCQEDRAAGTLADGQVDRPCGARRKRDRDHLAALIGTSGRCPRSRPKCSMSVPVASEARRPFRASSEISACSGGGPSPAATRVPSSLRSNAAAWDS